MNTRVTPRTVPSYLRFGGFFSGGMSDTKLCSPDLLAVTGSGIAKVYRNGHRARLYKKGQRGAVEYKNMVRHPK
jgi:hypothetical protein